MTESPLPAIHDLAIEHPEDVTGIEIVIYLENCAGFVLQLDTDTEQHGVIRWAAIDDARNRCEFTPLTTVPPGDDPSHRLYAETIRALDEYTSFDSSDDLRDWGDEFYIAILKETA